MDLHDDTYAVVVRSLVHLEDTRCFEYSESVHRLDKFRFVEFADAESVNSSKESKLLASVHFGAMIGSQRGHF